MRDVIRYVNSPDVREHLRKLGYAPDTRTSAQIVYRTEALSLAEKHAIYRELAAEDASFDPEPLIRSEQQALADFMQPRDGVAYEAESRTSFGRYRTPADALLHGREDADGCFTVTRTALFDGASHRESDVMIKVNPAGTVIRLYSGDLPADLEAVQDAPLLPTPFQPGDALRVCDRLITPYDGTMLLTAPVDEDGMARCIYRCGGFLPETTVIPAVRLRYAKADEPLPDALACAARYLRGELDAELFFTAYPLLCRRDALSDKYAQALMEDAGFPGPYPRLPDVLCDISIDAP